MSAEQDERSRSEGETPSAAGRALCVLVAEDSPFNQHLTAGLLARHGHQAVVAGTGRDALALCESTRFDVVLMDVELPDMDGMAVTAEIRRREQGTGRHLPIVAMTAHEVERSQAECLAAGMDAFLMKPVRPQEMLAAIETATSCPVQEGRASQRDPAQPVSASAGAEVDWPAALAGVGGRRALLLELIGLFFQEYPELLARIARAIAADDAANLQLYAHRLKGSLRYFGDSPAANLAAQLEQLGREGHVARATSPSQQLRAALDQIVPQLRDFAAGRGRAAESGEAQP
jgi:CheY-like chemotaxis protein